MERILGSVAIRRSIGELRIELSATIRLVESAPIRVVERILGIDAERGIIYQMIVIGVAALSIGSVAEGIKRHSELRILGIVAVEGVVGQVLVDQTATLISVAEGAGGSVDLLGAREARTAVVLKGVAGEDTVLLGARKARTAVVLEGVAGGGTGMLRHTSLHVLRFGRGWVGSGRRGHDALGAGAAAHDNSKLAWERDHDTVLVSRQTKTGSSSLDRQRARGGRLRGSGLVVAGGVDGVASLLLVGRLHLNLWRRAIEIVGWGGEKKAIALTK